jgi:ABC-type oligopeptide transport system substrate-binding subunit
VTVRPVFLTSDELYEACRRGEHDMVVFGWIPDYPDPENIYVILSRQGKAAGYNLALYEDEAFNDLLEKARRELQPHRREKLFAEIEQRLEQKQPWLPLVFVSSFVAIRNDVKGVRLGIEQCLGGADLFLRQAHLKNPSD